MKKVSVVVRTKERPHLLEEALESLALQTYPHLEVVVVNDGGPPELEDRLSAFPGPLVYVRHDTCQGRSAAANTGLARAQGELVGFLDEDDLLLPWAVAELVEALETQPAPLVYGCSRVVRTKEDRTLLVRIYGRPFDRVLLHFENYIPMGSFLVQREALEGVRFDETFQCLEDWDFLLQLAQKGDFLFLKRLVHIYRLQPDSFAAGEATRYARETHWRRIYERYHHFFTPQRLYHLERVLREEIQEAEHQAALWQEHYYTLLRQHHYLLEVLHHTEETLRRLEAESHPFREEQARLEAELQQLEALLAEKEAALALIHDSLAWQLIERYRRLRDRLLPGGTRRRHFYDLCLKGLRVLLRGGPRLLARKALHYWQKQHSLPTPPRPPALPKVDPEELVFPAVEEPRVSVVIPVFNQLDLTLSCLASLVRYTPEIYEVIVVDDASTDDTPRVLSRIRNLRYLRQEENQGFVGSVNTGAQVARGQVLVFLNNDTLLTPGWLEALLEALSEEKVGAVGAKLIYPDGRLQEAGGIVFRDASGWNYGHLQDPAAPEYNFRREVDYCSGACLAVRRALFEELGGFDKLFSPAYYEDADLCFRLRQRGYRVLYQPRAEVFHLEGASCGRDLSKGLKRYQVVNQERFRQRWQETLEREHFPPDPAYLFLARQRQGRGIVLVVDHYVPTWDQDAGSLRLYHLLCLMRELDYRLIFWPDNLAVLQPYTRKLQDLGIEVIYGPHDFEGYLRERARFVDLVWACRARFAPRYLEAARRFGVKTVFDTVDLHFLREAREAELRGDEALRRQAEETKRLELALCRTADRTLVVSRYEKEMLEGLGLKQVELLPTVHQLEERGPGFAERQDLMFIGSFQHPPNEDAVLWFVEEIWPLIRRELPGVRFWVVGSSPTPRIKALHSDEIRVTGYVPEVAPYFRRSRVFVAPLRYGAGFKGKVGQALSFGLPSVLTSVAAEGLGARDGEEILLADRAPEFARAVVRLYQDPELWERLSRQGQALIARHFSPQAVRRTLERMLSELVPEPKWRRLLR